MEKDLTPIYSYMFSFKREPQKSEEELNQYFQHLDRGELKFRQCVTECVICKLSEVIPMLKEDVKRVIECNSGKWLRGCQDDIYKRQCKYVHEKAKDALEYLNKMEKKYVDMEIEPSTTANEEKKKTTNKTKIISGTVELSEYLGCSKSSATKIINSKILLENNIQYKVGNCWKFNSEILDNFLTEHPNILGKISPRFNNNRSGK